MNSGNSIILKKNQLKMSLNFLSQISWQVQRADILQLLLENLANNKVKRLFLYLAQKAGHVWFDKLDVSKIDLSQL